MFRFKSLISALLLLGMLAVSGANAQQTSSGSSVAFRRAAELKRGINLSSWYVGWADTQEHRDTYTTAEDMKVIHSLGLQYVRFGLDPALLTKKGLHSSETTAMLQQVDNVIDMVLAEKLSIMICIFPSDAYKQQLQNQKGVDDFIMLWRLLAAHVARRDPEHVFLELINEPEVNDPYRWMGIQASTIAAIRQVDTVHTIIATAARYSGLDDLLRVQPVADANVIYNFHYYEPYQFTHQGASWGSSEWPFFKDIPYPATAEMMKNNLANVPDDSARYVLYLYASGGWNHDSILGRLTFAGDWGKEHHVPVICNEFGAYKNTAPADSRAKWIHDVRTNLDDLQIGWAMWDYRGDFGLVTHEGDKITVDPAIAKALGLQ